MKTLTTLLIAATAMTLWGDEADDLRAAQAQAERAREAAAREAAVADATRAVAEANRAAAEATRQTQFFVQADPKNALPPNGGAGRVVVERRGRKPARQIRTLVVSPKTTEPKAIAQIEEDLAVMSRLLNKEVEKEVGNDPERAMGIVISSWGGETKAPEAIYLDGYGALFTLNVNFPLMATPEDKEEVRAAAPADSEWDKARQEVFGGNEPFDTVNVVGMPGMNTPQTPYDPDRVDNLKRAVLNALRNAVNIRALQPDDFVNVAVLSYPNRFGGNNVFGTAHANFVMTQTIDGKTVTKSSDTSTDTSRQSTLTVRVKKADLDSFNSGKLTLDELKKKANVTVYGNEAEVKVQVRTTGRPPR